MARILIGLGLVLLLAGLIALGAERLAGSPGRGLPGDLTIRWGNGTVYLPIMTSILISLVLTAVLSIINAAGRR